MEYRKLGRSGLKVSSLSFGSWVTFHNQVDIRKAKELMSCAFEAGVNFFDNAETYADGESEKIMGEVLKQLGWNRDTFIVSSKVYWGGNLPTQRGLSRKHVVDACHAALRRLQIDYLDLYFCHRPDQTTPIEETVWVMNDLIRQGKVLYWGTSEWSAEEIREAYGVAQRDHLIGPTMEQPQYNLFCRDRVEAEYRRLFDTVGLGTTIWSPLASGVLAGRYKEGVPSDSRLALPGYEWLRNKVFASDIAKANLEKVNLLANLAKEIGLTQSQLAIAWCLKNPDVSTVILGASKVAQLKENLQSLEVVHLLTPEVMAKIESIVCNKPKPAPVY